MNASVDFTAPDAGQPLLRAVLRGLRVLFRGLVRPPMPIAGQRAVIRALTSTPVAMRGVTRSRDSLGGVPCEWHRPARDNGSVLLYLHGGAWRRRDRAITATLARRGRLRAAPGFPAARQGRCWPRPASASSSAVIPQAAISA